VSGCTSIDAVVITADVNVPLAVVGDDTLLDCNNTTATLDGTGSSTGADFNLQWTASNGGNIVSGENSLMPIVDSAGIYELVVTNISNNCSANTSVNVTVDTIAPTANAGLDTAINCYNPTVLLEAFGSSTGFEYSYEWKL